MKIIVLFSGGKDSTFALHETIKQGHQVLGLLTVISKNPYSYMFHYPCISLTSLQAEALNIPIYTITSEGRKEEELNDLEDMLNRLKAELKIDAVVSGAIASRYQKTRIDNICLKLKIKSFTPLWGSDPETLLRKMVDSGFEVVFTAVSAEGLTEKWLNRRLDEEVIEELKTLNRKFGVHISLEGGEGETFVKDAPLFTKKINFLEVEKIWKRDSGYIIVKKAQLVDK